MSIKSLRQRDFQICTDMHQDVSPGLWLCQKGSIIPYSVDDPHAKMMKRLEFHVLFHEVPTIGLPGLQKKKQLK